MPSPEGMDMKWLIELYAPRAVEFERNSDWRRACMNTLHEQPSYRISLLSHIEGVNSFAGGARGYDVLETYRIFADGIEADSRTCLVCGKPVHGSRESVIGFSLHKSCNTGMLTTARAEELKLFGEPLPQLRSWASVFSLR